MPARLHRVALLIESSRTYGRGILRGIAQYAHLHGPWSCFTEERELHSGIPAWLKGWKGHGIIARIEDRRMVAALHELDIPIVDVLGNGQFEGIPAFDTDADAVARFAVDFFLQCGFQHFAYCGFKRILFSERREAAFIAHLAQRGKKVCVFSSRLPGRTLSHIQAVEQHGLSMENTIAQWLKRQPRPLALFACNDVRAQQVLNACREHRIRVPEEVAVMGVDNDDVLCNLCEPPLTSIEPDTERLGYEAAALLDQMMKRGERGAGSRREADKNTPPATSKPLTQIPPIRVAERASTDVVAIEDPIAVQAVRFIRDQVNGGIAVKDVLAHVNRSRTDLERRFRRWLGCSIHDEIVRRRLDRACSLLQQTNLRLDDVAHRTGFSTSSHLCRLFQHHLRRSPTDFRQQKPASSALRTTNRRQERSSNQPTSRRSATPAAE